MQNLILILYVQSQQASRDFYAALLQHVPTLDVPGMTEFPLLNGCTLGLMPNSGIGKLISPPLPHPSEGEGIPRCELYLRVQGAKAWTARALAAGAMLVRPAERMNWGETVTYLSDPDGHVIALAEALPA